MTIFNIECFIEMDINEIADKMHNREKKEDVDTYELYNTGRYDLQGYLGEDSTLGLGTHRVWHANKINVLLVGRSQTGKSTIVETMIDPQKGTTSNGFSITKKPGYNSLLLHDNEKNMSFQLNIIDTPGLQEVHENDESRTDAELLKLAAVCVEKHITSLNVVCFVSRAGETHRNDVVLFDTVQKFLGDKFADISMMVLTHCDEFSDKRLKEFERNIHDHEISKPISQYCKLGIAQYGAINYTTLEQFPEKDVQQAVVRSKLTRIGKMRKQFIDKIISCADRGLPINELQAIYEDRERVNKERIDELKVEYEERERVNKERIDKLKAEYEERERVNKEQMNKNTQNSVLTTASMVSYYFLQIVLCSKY
jgi:GTPase Era involved in 16S rRNA processing